MGAMSQGWFEDGVYWYGVEFGGAIGWRKVAQADCKTLDFLNHPLPRPYTTISAQAIPYRAPSPSYDGSIGRLQNQAARPNNLVSVLGSPTGTPIEVKVDDLTPPMGPRRFGSRSSPIDLADYAPLTRYEVWTSDSHDSSWMAYYQDFSGNSSDDENCNWLLLEDEDERLSVGESLDLEHYEEFVHLNRDCKLAIEDIRSRFADDKWGQAYSQLLGDCATFSGPCSDPMEQFNRQRRFPAYFFFYFGTMSPYSASSVKQTRTLANNVQVELILRGGGGQLDPTEVPSRSL